MKDMLLAFFLTTVIAACAMQEEQVAQELKRPINCTTAKGDLRVLQQEKANVASQVAQGLTAISPAGIVMGMVTGTETTKLEVATGEYNQMIDQRIAEIKQKCGL